MCQQDEKLTVNDIAAAKVTETDVPIMFTDLKGPIRTPGVHGELYYQAYMASHTKYVMCYFMQFKSSTVDTLKDLLEIQLPAEGSRLITYCADDLFLEILSAFCLSTIAR